jgi:putative ABC transport system permease protein
MFRSSRLRLETILRDVRYAWRLVARHPGFAAASILTLAIGLGTMTVAFSAVNAFFIRSPPIEGAGAGLVMVSGSAPEGGGASFLELEAFTRDVSALDICAQTIVTLSHRQGDVAGIAWGLAVTDNYFDMLGVTAAAGRTFARGDAVSAVISDRFWRRTLSGASLAGLSVRLNGVDVPVVGVLSRDFRAGFYDPDVWVRIADWDALRLPLRSRRPDAPTFTLFGRLRSDATAALANRQLQLASSELARAWPKTNVRRTASFVTFEEGLPELRALATVAVTAMSMIAVVLLIAVFNVMGLLLSRAVDRQREMSLRGALGATRGRLSQQLVTESLVLAAIAAGLALLVSRWSNQLLGAFAPEAPIPQRLDVTPDWTVAIFTSVLMIGCGVAAGLLPARRATSLAIAAAMAPGAGPRVAGAGRLRASVVSLQMAGATLLLAFAALLLRTAVLTAQVDVGFDVERTLVLEIDPASHGYAESAAHRFIADAVAALRALPGVTSASVTDRVPFYVGFPVRLEVSLDGQSCGPEPCPTAGSYRVGADYFRTLRIPVTRGREFTDSGADGQSAIVSETMARRFWSSGDPLGQWVSLGVERQRVQVVGVAADIVHRSVNEVREPYIYLPFDAAAAALPVAIVLRTTRDPELLLATVREQVRRMDPGLPIYSLRTMRQRLDAREQSGALIVTRFFALCGGLALVLSIVGLGGSVSYSVRRRSREFAIHAAIGASPFDIARHVIGGGLRMTVPGICVGLFSAVMLSRLASGQLRNLNLDSPLTVVAVAVLQLLIAIAACAVPSYRASLSNPLGALRSE